MDKTKYYVLNKKAVPEVLLKVVEVKHLLATRKGMTIGEAAEAAGISRSSFYKYKDDIFPFHENEKGTDNHPRPADGGYSGTAGGDFKRGGRV